MGAFNDTMSDLGAGTGNFLTSIAPPLILFIVGLGVGGAVAVVIKNAISKNI